MAEFSFELENLDRSSGVIIDDALVNSSADYNGDGIEDLVVSSPSAGSTNQELQIIYGGDDLPANLDLEDANGSTILEDADSLLNVVLFTNHLDFNGDEIDDLIYISLQQSAGGQPNSVSRLIFGSENLPTTIDPSDLDGSNGLEFTGEQPIILAQGIDINDDDSDDLIFSTGDLSAAEADLENYIFLGSDRNFNPTLNPTSVNGRNGLEIDDNGFAPVLEITQDINDDGINDLAINLFGVDGVQSSSILFGSETFPASIDPATFDGDDGLNIVAGDAAEGEVATTLAFFIEDSNDDEIADILVNQAIAEDLDDLEESELEEFDPSNANSIANSEDVSGQRIFLVFGSETFDETIDLADIDGDNGVEIVNSANDEINLISTNTVDLNNDGLQDLVVNDLIDDRTYVVFGQSKFEEEIDLADLNGDDGFVLAEASFSYINSYTGDINGDSLDDLILETDRELTYVIYGTEDDFGAEFDPTGDVNALVIFSQNADLAILDILDLNGDGTDDLVYQSLKAISPVFELDMETDIPDIQIVYGDPDLGTTS